MLAASAAAGLLGWVIAESVDVPFARGIYTTLLVVLLIRDSVSRRLRWLAVRALLSDPTSVQELAVLPNPNAFLVEWLKRRDAARALELIRVVLIPGLVIAVFSGFAEGPGSHDFRARLALLCTATLAATRIVLHRVLAGLAEVELIASPPQLAQLALRRIGDPMGSEPGALGDILPVAYNPALLIVAGVTVGVLLYLDTASDAIAMAALVVLPAVFPLYALLSRPRLAETTIAAERATSGMMTALARSGELAKRAKPAPLPGAHS